MRDQRAITNMNTNTNGKSPERTVTQTARAYVAEIRAIDDEWHAGPATMEAGATFTAKTHAVWKRAAADGHAVEAEVRRILLWEPRQ